MSVIDVVVTGALIVAGLAIGGIWMMDWVTEPQEKLRWTLIVVVLALGSITFAPSAPFGLSPRVTGFLLAVQAILVIAIFASDFIVKYII